VNGDSGAVARFTAWLAPALYIHIQRAGTIRDLARVEPPNEINRGRQEAGEHDMRNHLLSAAAAIALMTSGAAAHEKPWP
jgi:hypothetical protein